MCFNVLLCVFINFHIIELKNKSKILNSSLNLYNTALKKIKDLKKIKPYIRHYYLKISSRAVSVSVENVAHGTGSVCTFLLAYGGRDADVFDGRRVPLLCLGEGHAVNIHTPGYNTRLTLWWHKASLRQGWVISLL